MSKSFPRCNNFIPTLKKRYCANHNINSKSQGQRQYGE